MKILSASQIRELDQYTISNEPIASIDLMERASRQVTNWLIERYPIEQKFTILCGPGNNGGDGLAVARQLIEAGYKPSVFLLKSPKVSEDCLTNQDRLADIIEIQELSVEAGFPSFQSDEVIIDALLGTGLKRGLEGYLLKLVERINELPNTTIAIDIASGLFDQEAMGNNLAVEPDFTLTFQIPKLNFLLPSTHQFCGAVHILPIGLDERRLGELDSPYFLVLEGDCGLPKRPKYGHKGTFGHALIVAGQKGSVGAAILSAKACLRSGVGLLTCHLPGKAESIMQTVIPEAMVQADNDDTLWSVNGELSKYAAIGIGPGIGQHAVTKQALAELIEEAQVPLVLDADALNILAQDPEMLMHLPNGCILTPHPKELERLVGVSATDQEQLARLSDLAQKIQAVVLLKRAHTVIATPGGELFFNTTGNPGMGTGGSGDVLTGILTALLAQGIRAEKAAKIGVFVHGAAGDLAAVDVGERSLIASDIIMKLPQAFMELG